MTADYIANGLIYCGNCHTPKQILVDLGGGERPRPVLCRCQKEAYEAKRDQERQEQRYLKAMESPVAALDFGMKPDPAQCERRVARYIQKWPQMQQDNIGLLLWGGVGTGKTVSAACIVQALREQKIPCLMTSLIKLANKDFGGLIGQLGRFDFLVLDDLGAERSGTYTHEKVYEIIDDRVRQKKPMALTTNLTLDQLKQESNVDLKRIYDRILSVCVPIQFRGESFRQAQNLEKLDKARRELG